MITHSTTRSHRIAAVFLAAIFALLMLCSVGAKADETARRTITAGVPESINIENKNKVGFATILSTSTADASIVTVAYTSSNFTLTGLKAGSTVVTVKVHDNSDNTEYNWLITVTVQGSSTGTTRNVSLIQGSSVTLDNFSSVSSTNSSNPSVVNVSQSGTAVIAAGQLVGSSTVTVTGVLSGTSSQLTYTYYVTVTTGSTSTNTSSVTLKVGQDAVIGQGGAYSSVSNYASSNTAVASVSVNNNVLTISAHSAGTATVTFTATVSGTGQVVTYTINVTVNGTTIINNGDYIENVYNDGYGLEIGMAERLVAEGKTYRLKGITLNGKAVAANELLWLSTDDDIVTINKTTGIFKARKTGTTRLIAVDTLGRYHLTVAITVQ